MKLRQGNCFMQAAYSITITILFVMKIETKPFFWENWNKKEFNKKISGTLLQYEVQFLNG